MEIDDILSRLVEVIKSSQEFTRFKQTKTIIANNPVLNKELEEFSLAQSQLFSKGTAADEAQLRYKYESLSKIPEVKNYFNALNSLNKLMDKIYASIKVSLGKSL